MDAYPVEYRPSLGVACQHGGDYQQPQSPRSRPVFQRIVGTSFSPPSVRAVLVTTICGCHRGPARKATGAPRSIWGPRSIAAAYDAEPWLSPDGLALFFSSNRPGGMGSYDLWLTTRRSRDAAWSASVNVGPAINTSSGEGAPTASPDLKTLYFISDRPGGFGSWDIYEVSVTPIVDFNGDGIVETDDLLRLIASWGEDDPRQISVQLHGVTARSTPRTWKS